MEGMISAVCREAALLALQENMAAQRVDAGHFLSALGAVRPRVPDALVQSSKAPPSSEPFALIGPELPVNICIDRTLGGLLEARWLRGSTEEQQQEQKQEEKQQQQEEQEEKQQQQEEKQQEQQEEKQQQEQEEDLDPRSYSHSAL
ncbi:hypothetical protein CRUP_001785 [Coryphaenoides rupestris]|nr:hypothetical protein CRUP_001785 [Coryphaenoides rupestris]